MSSGEKKARDSAGACPRLDPNPTSDDTKNPDAVTPGKKQNQKQQQQQQQAR